MRGIARAVRRVEPDAAVVVDAITGIGALPLETDAWELDAIALHASVPWRLHERVFPIAAGDTFYDDTPVGTPQELSEILMKRPLPLVRTFAANMLVDGPPCGVLRSAYDSSDRRGGGGGRLPHLVVHQGRGHE